MPNGGSGSWPPDSRPSAPTASRPPPSSSSAPPPASPPAASTTSSPAARRCSSPSTTTSTPACSTPSSTPSPSSRADDLHSRAVAAFTAYLDVITTDPRWVRITLRETLGASPATYAARHDALGRFANFLQLELDRLADAGAIPKRDHTLTAVAIVGGLTALVESLLPPDQPRHTLNRLRVNRVREAGVRLILSAGAEPDS